MSVFLTFDEIEMMHEVLIRKFGGASGIRDHGALEAAIYRPQTGYYSDVIEQAAALFESLAINHPFIDGNKRIAFAATDVFLRLNGYKLHTSSTDAYKVIIGMFDRQELNLVNLNTWLRAIAKASI